MDFVTVLEMPDGLSGQEAATAPGMDLPPSTGRLPVALPTRCAHDVNGDHKLTVDDVLWLLDASKDAEACVLQIVQELNKLRLKP
jgi:hypothetical protein